MSKKRQQSQRKLATPKAKQVIKFKGPKPVPNQAQPRMSLDVRGWETTQRVDVGRPFIRTKGDRIQVTNREIVNINVAGLAVSTSVQSTFVAGVATIQFGAVMPFRFTAGAPAGFNTGSWLYGLALNYDKFRILSLTYTFQPAVAVTYNGTIAMWWDSNQTSAGLSTPASYGMVSGNMNAKTTSIHDPIELRIRSDQLNRLPQYNTSAGSSVVTDNNTACPGTAKLAWDVLDSNTGLPVVATPKTIGYVWVDYTVEFINPSYPGT